MNSHHMYNRRSRPSRSMTTVADQRTHISEVFSDESPQSSTIPSANTSTTSTNTDGTQVTSVPSNNSIQSANSSLNIAEYTSSQDNDNNSTPIQSPPNSLKKSEGSTSSGSVGTSITHDSFASEKSLDSRFIDLARNIMKSEDEGDMKAFLFAYRRFASPTDLYSIFTALYNQLKHGHKSKKTKRDIKSVTQFATIWISNYYAVDFARKQVNEILEQLKDLDPNQQNAIKLQILRGHEMKRTLTSSSSLAHPATLRERSGSTIMRPPTVGSSNPTSPTTTDISSLSFLNLNPTEVAKALTMMEFDVFSKVFSTEFLIKIGWQNYYPPPGIHTAASPNKATPVITGPVATPGCPNLNFLIQRFNQVSFWVTTEVLTRKGKAQISTMHRFIEIAQKCYELNNYNSMMEILSGLNNGYVVLRNISDKDSAILRLKRLWASLSDRRLRMFEHLEEVMSAQQNFKNYYHELSEKQLPVLPYIALFLREFTFMYQGNSVFGPEDHINFDLFRQLHERAKFVQKFQQVAFKLTTDHAIMGFLNHLHYIEDDDILYQMSINTQPSMWLLDHNKHASDFSDSSGNSPARTLRESEKKPQRDYSQYDKNSQRSSMTGSDSDTDDDISVSGSETSELSSISHDTDSAKNHRRAASVGGSVTSAKEKDTESPATTSYHSNDTDSDLGRDTPLLSGKGGASGESSTKITPVPTTYSAEDIPTPSSLPPNAQKMKLRASQSANSEAFPNFPDISRARSSTIDKMFQMTHQIQAMHDSISFGQSVTANTRLEVEEQVPANQHITVVAPAPTPASVATPLPGVSESTSVQEPSSLNSSRISSQANSTAPSGTSTPSRISRQSSRARPRKTKKRSLNHCVTVKVPQEYSQVFANAERIIDKYFADCRHSQEKGIFEISDQRYILVRVASISHDFWEGFKAEVPSKTRAERSESNPNLSEFTQNFLFDLSHSVGKSDYHYFVTEFPMKTEMDLLATGFINIAFSGWGSAHIYEESMFTRDESFKLIFDVAHACEASTFVQSGAKSSHPVCILACGYTSGWCSELFGITLTCTEICCQAKGDPCCKFLMASPNRIDEYLSECIQELNLSHESSQAISVPTYMETRKERKYSFSKPSPPPNLTSSLDLPVHHPAPLKLTEAKMNNKSLSASSDNIRNVANVLYKGNQEQIVASKKMTKRSEKMFHSMQCDPEHATINFAEREDQRFLFLRGKSIGQEFVNLIKQLLRNEETAQQFSRKFLNDFGRCIAKADSQYLESSFETTNSIERLYLLPVMLLKLGWGKAEVCLGSRLKASDEFYLKFQVQHSFEGESYFLANNPKQLKRTPSFTLRSGTPPGNLSLPVCHLHCGYSAGFATHVFDMHLVTVEVSCIALNHSCCTFITAPPSKIFEHVKLYLAEHNRSQDWPSYSVGIQVLLGTHQTNEPNTTPNNNNVNTSPSVLRNSTDSSPGFFARLRKSFMHKEKD